MNSEEFKELLDKVDRLGVETYLPSILSGALKSMAEFFNIGEVQKSRIPLIAIRVYLEEKQLTKHVERLNSVFGEDGNMKFSINEYQKEFDGILPEKEESIQEEPERERFQPVIVEEHDLEPEPKVEIEEETLIEAIKPEESFGENVLHENDVEPEKPQEEIQETGIVEPSTDHKPVKIRIKVKENNEIERIDNEELNEQKETSKVEKREEEKEQTLFDNYEEDVVVDQTEKAGVEETVEPVAEEQIDTTTEEIEPTLDENEDSFNEFIDDDETKEIYKYADESLKNIEKKLETGEEDENESMLQSILSNSDSDNEDNMEDRLNDSDSGNKINSPKTDLAELLEHKEMTKIIEVVFEYDIDEFSNILEEIIACQELDDAYIIINQALKERGFRRRSKEAQLFKQIISEYFNRR
jgi:hypothetical protein